MNSISKLFTLLLLAGLFTFTSCGDDDMDPVEELTLVETAQADPQFSTLVAALVKADLVGTLNSGDFTVFAPTNDAFDALFTDLGVTGLDDLSAEALTPILLYHVVGGVVNSTDLTAGYVGTASTGPNDQPIKLKVDLTNGVKLNNGSTVTTADVTTTSGVIHVIDKVLLPPSVVDIATGNDDFSILVAALTRSDLNFDFVNFLSGDGPFTVFAPTNAAFQALLEGNPAWSTLDDIDAVTLEAVLKYHVISGVNAESASLVDGTVIATANSATVTINTVGDVTITGGTSGVSTVDLPDVQGKNGVVHVIDKVLVP